MPIAQYIPDPYRHVHLTSANVVGIPGQGEGPPMKTWYTIGHHRVSPIRPPNGGTGDTMPSSDSGTDDSDQPVYIRVALDQSNAQILHSMIATLEGRDIDDQIRILRALWYYFHMDSR